MLQRNYFLLIRPLSPFVWNDRGYWQKKLKRTLHSKKSFESSFETVQKYRSFWFLDVRLSKVSYSEKRKRLFSNSVKCVSWDTRFFYTGYHIVTVRNKIKVFNNSIKSTNQLVRRLHFQTRCHLDVDCYSFVAQNIAAKEDERFIYV